MQRLHRFFLCALALMLASWTFSAQAQIFGVAAEPDSLGPIPDGAGVGPGNYGDALNVRFIVDDAPGRVGEVSVNFNANHDWVGDVRVRLIAPDGTDHLIFEQSGVAVSNLPGFQSRLSEDSNYGFSDAASVHWWDAANLNPGEIIPSTNARSVKSGDASQPFALPAITSMNEAFLGTPIEGTWTLRFDDGYSGSVGQVTDAFIFFLPDTPDLVVLNDNDAGPGSLRQAMSDAGAGQTIAFDPVFFATARTIDLQSALPPVQQSLYIQGPGADLLTVQRSASAANDFQPFFTTGFEGRFALSGLRISGGTNLAGGGVFTQATSFRGSELDIVGNEARIGGGLAIADAQQALLLNSLIRANSERSGDLEEADGSGLFVSCLLVSDCSFSMANSTVTGNAPGANGEIAAIVLSMGGGFAFDATIENNTIVSDSTGLRLFERIATPNTALDVSVNSNIVDAPESIDFEGQGGIFTVGSFCCNLTTDDFFGASEFHQSNTNPELQPLADNGGPTFTHAISLSSPAVDNGSARGSQFDQRGPGFPRTFNTGNGSVSFADGTDAGAFEYTPEDRIFSSRFEIPSVIIGFEGINFTPNEDGVGGSIRWSNGSTCDCDTLPFDFNIYRSGGELAFFWPGSTARGGVTLDGSSYAILLPGSIVGPDSDFLTSSSPAAASAWATPAGQDAILGFRFDDNGQTKYGYVRIETGPGGSPATIVSYAFENNGGPITVE